MDEDFGRPANREDELLSRKRDLQAELSELYELAEDRYYDLQPDAREREREFFRSSSDLLRKVQEFRAERRDDLERTIGLDPYEQRELAEAARRGAVEAEENHEPYDPRYDRRIGTRIKRYFSAIRGRMHELKADLRRINDELEDITGAEQDRHWESPVEASYYLGVS